MHSVSFLTVALIISQAAIAAPISGGKTSSVSGTGNAIIGNAVNGAANGAVSNLLSKIEGLFKRDENSPLTNDEKKQILVALVDKAQSAHPSKRGLGTTIINNAAKGAGNAAASKILSEIESLFKREPGIGPTIVKEATSGAASAVFSSILGEIENLFKRESSLNDLD